METAITGLIIIAVLILSIVGLTERSISAQTTIAQSASSMQERVGERARTSIAPVRAEVTAFDTVEITLRNTGSLKLADYNQWDIILEYDAGGGAWQKRWIPYTSGLPLANQWTVARIYQNAAALSPEVFDPHIFDPGEEMVIQIKVDPPVGPGTTNLATVSTSNGISASTVFTH